VTEDKRATVLGLGAMGGALAGALLAAGRPTTVWNRSPDKAAPLVDRGAVRASTVTDAVQASRLVVVCLLDDRSVYETLEPASAALAGRVLVNLTNGTPRQARELATWAAARDVEFVDGGIMAVPPMVGTPEAFVLYSGSQTAFDAHRDALDAFGDAIFVGSDPGAAALQDIALLSGMYGMMSGFLHAFALVRSAGVEATAFAPMLQRWLAGMDGLVEREARRIDTGDYATGVVSNLAMQAAGYANLVTAAEEQGVSPELITPLRSLFDRRVAAGHGHEDVTGVIDLLPTREHQKKEKQGNE
jgi:3-hydroxyisobutyrate dehydrogenase-like beta-hydroxyacid dehydrogenase